MISGKEEVSNCEIQISRTPNTFCMWISKFYVSLKLWGALAARDKRGGQTAILH